MKSVQFKNGDSMPTFGLGTWKSAPGEVYKAVKEAIRIGYRHIDCAPIYGNEAEVGQALTECVNEGLVRRDELWITSKVWNNAHASEDVLPAIQKTLTDLQIDYLDLLLIHWPVVIRKGLTYHESGSDLISLDDIPIIETWRQMEVGVDKGLCRNIGVSNFSIVKLEALIEASRIKPEMNQVELHPYLQQPKMLDFCKDNNLHLTAYAPLGSGDRPDMLKTDNQPIILENPTIIEISERLNTTPAQLLISWAMHRGTVVIPKSVNADRLKQNLGSVELSLSEDDMEKIAKLDTHTRYVNGSFWALEGSPYTMDNLWDE